MVVSKQGYQDVEEAGTRKGLEEAGFTMEICSTETGPCRGKFGGILNATVALRDVDVSRYDRIAFVGGPGAGALAEDPGALRVARNAAAAGMKMGAICIAPTILAAAGVLKGKRATVWDRGGEQAHILRESGALYTGDAVTVDGLLVTGNGPEAAEEFGRTLAAL